MRYHRKYKKNRGLILIFLALIAAILVLPAGAQKKISDIETGEEILFQSRILNEDRLIFVSQPGFAGTVGSKIPTIYLLDGDVHFDYVVGMISFLATQKLIPPTRVVAITNVNRNRDFTPVSDPATPASGGASRFHAFIEQELVPFIQKRYYTSGYRILLGHSLGGMFASWSMLNHQDAFDAYIAISPYLQWSDSYMIRETAEKLPVSFEHPQSWFMTLGDEPDYVPIHSAFIELLEKEKPANLKHEYRVFPEEDHGTVPLLSVYYGLQYIFADFPLQPENYLEGISSIEQHNQYLNEKYGMDIQLDEQSINLLGYRYIRLDRLEDAIQTMQENVRRFPESANVYDSLGDAYKAAGRLEEARTSYEKAVKLGEKQQSPYLDTYLRNLESLPRIAK